MIKIKNGKVNLGIFLIIIGSLWILSNFGIVDINLYSIFRLLINGIFDLWPLILIILGMGMIFKNDLLNTILWIIFLLVVLSYSLFFKGDLVGRNNDSLKEESYIVEMSEDIELGGLHLDVGATNFSVDSIEDDFIRIEHDGAFEYTFDNRDSIEYVYLSNEKVFLKNNFLKNSSNRSLEIAINKDIPWEFNMDIGAISGRLDLKDIMVEHLILDMGAGDLEMTLGNKNDFTLIDIDAGASKLVLNLPRDVGLDISFDGGLNSTNLDSLDLIKNNNSYISKNYEDTASKYEIEVNMGVGEFVLNYY